MVNLTEHKSKIVASFLTFLVIGLLIMAGPAQAFQVSLGAFDDANPTQGQIISTTASVAIESNERVNIDYVNMTVNGQDYCMFDAYTGANLSECAGVSVQVLSDTTNSGYGYGYGYGFGYGYGYQNGYSNGEFTYNISVNTSAFDLGVKSIQLFVNLGGQVYDSGSQTFNVTTADVYAEAYDNVSSGLDVQGIGNNLDEITEDNVQNFTGLYFEKAHVGKITFTQGLNLSDSATQTFLQNLDTYLNISNGHISLNTEFAAFLSGAGAIISMNDLPSGLTLGNITLTITDDDGNVLNVTEIASNMSYTSVGACEVFVSQCSVFSFSTLHFTSFDTSIGEETTTTTTSSSGGSGSKYDGSITKANYSITTPSIANNNVAVESNLTESTTTPRTSLFTGAVIGAIGSKSFWAIIVFVVIVAGAYMIVRRKKTATTVAAVSESKPVKAKKKKKSKK